MKNPAAVALGKMKSAAKSKAARENGKLGGRPRKPKRVARRANAGAEPCATNQHPTAKAELPAIPRIGSGVLLGHWSICKQLNIK